ncbi:MAG: PDGLE domain-containing protein [Candidatus Omnitrophica bacterium]|nr:PDGLE domain-containing protein [Candidatus Omnitrophota bacterium]MDD5351979.1 PDGLE domain-containing protein [Candidatus Omnitrophota bacterium]MDD5551033.1 PDGLE domain-containing protein [Candidatus Omnitrophota bacterium]
MKTTTKLWIGLGIFILLSPLGLMLPELFKAGDAWGEWGTDGIKELIGYIPRGLEKLSSFWSAPMPDYAFKGWEEKGLTHLSFAYIISAVLGIIIITAVILLLGKFISKKED